MRPFARSSRHRSRWRSLLGCAGRGLLALAATMPWAPAADTVPRIACVGDSITFGYGLDDQSANWPNTLARLLAAQNPVVGNFGVNGATLLKGGDLSYWGFGEFAQAGAFAPTTVLIMLGTNDSRPPNWEDHGGEFAADLTAMVAHFRALPSRPRVVLMTPPAAFSGAFGIRGDIIRDAELPLIRGVAADLALAVVDVHAATAAHADWFPDGIHPNPDGMAAIAAAVAAGLATGGDAGGGAGSGIGSPGSTGSGASAGGHRGCGLGSGFSLAVGSLALGLIRRRGGA